MLQFLSGIGMNASGMFVATALISASTTIMMGLIGNIPLVPRHRSWCQWLFSLYRFFKRLARGKKR